MVKCFKQPAQSQELILAAFQEEHWPAFIDDPLPAKKGKNSKRRLHSTVGNLNRGLKHKKIRFVGGGDGESIGWVLLPKR